MSSLQTSESVFVAQGRTAACAPPQQQPVRNPCKYDTTEYKAWNDGYWSEQICRILNHEEQI